jgi:hypothetical protein
MLSSTMTTMMAASTRSPSSADAALATSRMSTSGLANRPRICRTAPVRRVAAGSFGPYGASLRRASSLVSPCSDERNCWYNPAS